MKREKIVCLCRAKGGTLLTPGGAGHLRGRVELKEPGEETGAHLAEGREEVLIVLEGTATVELGRGRVRRVRVRPGHSLFIPEGTWHNVRNLSGRVLRYVYIRSLSAREGMLKKS